MLFDDGRILFVDQSNIESMSGVRLTLNPPEKRGVCLRIEREWEMERARPSCIVEWRGEYRFYYRVTLPGGIVALAFAVSTDGVDWTRPDLGAVSFAGSKSNNLCDVGEQRPGEHCVFVDPTGPDEHRFKLVANSGNREGMILMTSPDGIRFTRADAVLLRFFTDNHMTAFYDRRIGRYRIYTRGWDRSRKLPVMGAARSVVLAEVDTLFESVPFDANAPDPWPSEEPQMSADGKVIPHLRKINRELPTAMRCDEMDPPETDLYQSATVQYLPDLYLSFPSIYFSHPWPPEGFVNDGLHDLQFASSRDGLFWQRNIREPYVRLDPPGGMSTKTLHMLVGMVPNGDRLSHYYLGSTHSHGEGRLTVQMNVDRTVSVGDPLAHRLEQRMDGFVSADSEYSGGMLTTRPFVARSTGIKINVDTSASGVAYAALVDEFGREIPGFSMEQSDRIQGNDTQYPLSWAKRGDTSALIGKNVRLVIKSRGTKLFAVYP